jgi:gamma-glutamyl hercynylcysteine S-oxide synthase
VNIRMSENRTVLRTFLRRLRASIILLLCLLALGIGHISGSAPSTGGGAVGMCYLLLLAAQAHDPSRKENRETPAVSDIALPTNVCSVEHSCSDNPIERMVHQSRYSLLLMKEVVERLSESQFRMALDAFQQRMAIVPEGDVEVLSGMEFISEDSNNDAADRSPPGCLVHVEPFFLDRWPVTNRQYYEFVAAGGYHEVTLWDRSIWPAVLDMVDQTGLPGPRFWKDGCYLPGEEELPVVGIGWYEAAACARWMCKRLPTNAEWVKAASWPIPIDGNKLAHRRYPWGDAMDRTRANVWGSTPNRVVSVGEFAEGVSVGGVYQLIGNVWEWLDGNFHDRSSHGRLELPTPMKSIRGGAFDTYFDSQANTQFQSGENPLSRRHNIGFRCAIGMRNMMLSWPTSEAPSRRSDGVIDENEETTT